MVYLDKRWRLFFVWLLDPEFLHAYEVMSLSLENMQLEEKIISLNEGDMIFKFVSVYGFEETIDPLYINPIYSCFNAGVRPTSAWLQLPMMKNPWMLSNTHLHGLPEEKEVGQPGILTGYVPRKVVDTPPSLCSSRI
jgi:hypothetical protein